MTEPTQLSEAEIDRFLLEQHERVAAEYEEAREVIQIPPPKQIAEPGPAQQMCYDCFQPVENPKTPDGAADWCDSCRARLKQEREREQVERAADFAERSPSRYGFATVDHPKLLAWLDNRDRRSLLLAGGVGRGKTWQMFGMGQEALRRGVVFSVAWAFVPELLRDLRPGGQRSEPDGMDDLYRSGLLLLDDLGAHKPTEWAETELGILLDRRWRDERPTIVTTNVPPKKLGEVLGERIASRLAGMCEVVTLDGPDRRKP